MVETFDWFTLKNQIIRALFGDLYLLVNKPWTDRQSEYKPEETFPSCRMNVRVLRHHSHEAVTSLDHFVAATLLQCQIIQCTYCFNVDLLFFCCCFLGSNCCRFFSFCFCTYVFFFIFHVLKIITIAKIFTNFSIVIDFPLIHLSSCYWTVQ